MATMAQLETAFRNADAAGDTDAARRLAVILKQARQDESFQLPGMENATVPGTTAQAPEPTLGEQAVGALETGATLATGATTGTLAGLGGFAKQAIEEAMSGKYGSEEAANRIEQAFQQGVQAGTYEPRTQAGQQQVEAVGKVAEQLVPLAPVGGAIAGEARLLGEGLQAAREAPAAALGATRTGQVAAPVVRAAQKYTPQVADTFNQAADKIGSFLRTGQEGNRESVGAARQAEAELRQRRAEGLPVPVRLTRGEREQNPTQLAFEREAMKTEQGKELAQRRAESNLRLQQNLEEFIDSSGAQTRELRDIGAAVDKPLRAKFIQDKKRINNLYDIAKKRGEGEEKLTLDALVENLNKNKSEASVVDILKFAKQKGKELGAFAEDENGNLIATPVSLNDSEILRQAISKATKKQDSRDQLFARDLRQSIDTGQEGKGGKFFKQARAARRKLSGDFENNTLIKGLMGTKRGTAERTVAFEQVLGKITSPSTSLDNVKQLGQLLKKSGSEGQQGWKEVQGGIINWLKNEATKGQRKDAEGNQLLSPAALQRNLENLDKGGKLDYVYGKAGAQKLRDYMGTVRDVLTDMEGTVNYSNTSSAMLRGLNALASALGRVPGVGAKGAALLAKSAQWIKDAEDAAKIREALKPAPIL